MKAMASLHCGEKRQKRDTHASCYTKVRRKAVRGRKENSGNTPNDVHTASSFVPTLGSFDLNTPLLKRLQKSQQSAKGGQNHPSACLVMDQKDTQRQTPEPSVCGLLTSHQETSACELRADHGQAAELSTCAVNTDHGQVAEPSACEVMANFGQAAEPSACELRADFGQAGKPSACELRADHGEPVEPSTCALRVDHGQPAEITVAGSESGQQIPVNVALVSDPMTTDGLPGEAGVPDTLNTREPQVDEPGVAGTLPASHPPVGPNGTSTRQKLSQDCTSSVLPGAPVRPRDLSASQVTPEPTREVRARLYGQVVSSLSPGPSATGVGNAAEKEFSNVTGELCIFQTDTVDRPVAIADRPKMTGRTSPVLNLEALINLDTAVNVDTAVHQDTAVYLDTPTNQDTALNQDTVVGQYPAVYLDTLTHQDTALNQDTAVDQDTAVYLDTPTNQDTALNQDTAVQQDTAVYLDTLTNQDTALNQDTAVDQDTAVYLDTPTNQDTALNQDTAVGQDTGVYLDTPTHQDTALNQDTAVDQDSAVYLDTPTHQDTAFNQDTSVDQDTAVNRDTGMTQGTMVNLDAALCETPPQDQISPTNLDKCSTSSCYTQIKPEGGPRNPEDYADIVLPCHGSGVTDTGVRLSRHDGKHAWTDSHTPVPSSEELRVATSVGGLTAEGDGTPVNALETAMVHITGRRSRQTIWRTPKADARIPQTQSSSVENTVHIQGRGSRKAKRKSHVLTRKSTRTPRAVAKTPSPSLGKERWTAMVEPMMAESDGHVTGSGMPTEPVAWPCLQGKHSSVDVAAEVGCDAGPVVPSDGVDKFADIELPFDGEDADAENSPAANVSRRPAASSSPAANVTRRPAASSRPAANVTRRPAASSSPAANVTRRPAASSRPAANVTRRPAASSSPAANVTRRPAAGGAAWSAGREGRRPSPGDQDHGTPLSAVGSSSLTGRRRDKRGQSSVNRMRMPRCEVSPGIMDHPFTAEADSCVGTPESDPRSRVATPSKDDVIQTGCDVPSVQQSGYGGNLTDIVLPFDDEEADPDLALGDGSGALTPVTVLGETGRDLALGDGSGAPTPATVLGETGAACGGTTSSTLTKVPDARKRRKRRRSVLGPRKSSKASRERKRSQIQQPTLSTPSSGGDRQTTITGSGSEGRPSLDDVTLNVCDVVQYSQPDLDFLSCESWDCEEALRRPVKKNARRRSADFDIMNSGIVFSPDLGGGGRGQDAVFEDFDVTSLPLGMPVVRRSRRLKRKSIELFRLAARGVVIGSGGSPLASPAADSPQEVTTPAGSAEDVASSPGLYYRNSDNVVEDNVSTDSASTPSRDLSFETTQGDEIGRSMSVLPIVDNTGEEPIGEVSEQTVSTPLALREADGLTDTLDLGGPGVGMATANLASDPADQASPSPSGSGRETVTTAEAPAVKPAADPARRDRPRRATTHRTDTQEQQQADSQARPQPPKAPAKKGRKRPNPEPSVEDIYLNKLWRNQMPQARSWETIYEEPGVRQGRSQYQSAKRFKRQIDTEDFYSQPRLRQRHKRALKQGWKRPGHLQGSDLDTELTARLETMDWELLSEEQSLT